jgi:hypothetical protein
MTLGLGSWHYDLMNFNDCLEEFSDRFVIRPEIGFEKRVSIEFEKQL